MRQVQSSLWVAQIIQQVQYLFQHIMSRSTQISSRIASFYSQNGYVVIPKAISSSLCQIALQEIERMKQVSGFSSAIKNRSACTHVKSNYFADSFNRVSHFFEDTYSGDNSLDQQSLIKVGHFLHTNKIFESITYGKPIEELQSELGISQPIVVQSMALEKLPRRGGKVSLHQDSTFLFNEPDTTKGYWIPLQDVTVENGCLWVIPGTHLDRLYFRQKVKNGEMVYDINGPLTFKEEDCIPIEMQKGDLIVFSGRLLHKSNDNTSLKSRYAYTWHTIEKNSLWSNENWLGYEQIMKHQQIKV